MNYKQVRGFTVIEMVAALAVLSLIALYGVKAAESYYFDAKLAELERNVSVVMSGLNAYYESRCSSGSLASSVTVDDLVDQGFIDDVSFTINPLDQQKLQVYFDRTNPTMLQVRILHRSHPGWTDVILPETIAAHTRATGYSRSVVYWNQAPSALTADDNVYNMQLKHMYEPGACQ